MKSRTLVSLLALACFGASYAHDWSGAAGNYFLDDAGNWTTTSETDRYKVMSNPGAPLMISQSTVSFMSGMMLRFSGAYSASLDFGDGHSLVDVGKNAATGLHVENGATVTITSGMLAVWNGAYLSDASTLIVNGSSSSLDILSGNSNIRGSSVFNVKTHPTLVITNGASVSTGPGTCKVGTGLGECNALTLVTGPGSRLAGHSLIVGVTDPNTVFYSTNRLTVTDRARLDADTFILGQAGRGCSHVLFTGSGTEVSLGSLCIGDGKLVSNSVLTVQSGAKLALTNSSRVARSQMDSGPATRLTVEGQGTEFITSEALAVYANGTFEVRDRAMAEFTAKGLNVLSKGSVAVSSGAALELGGSLWVDKGGALVVTDAILNNTSADPLTISSGGTLAATNSVVSVKTPSFNVSGKLCLKGGSLDYNRIYMTKDGSELLFEDAIVTGDRIEMTRSSTIRLVNSQLTLPSGIFMMGDSTGTDAANVALKRDIYICGTNTCLKTSQDNGFYVRGSNTTIHVEIPAEGLSNEHPVFDVVRIVQEGSKRIKVAITVDTKLCEVGGGTYELFRNYKSASNVDFEYDPTLIRLKEKDDNLYVRVRSSKGLVLIIR